jgi:hypothetical protein
MTQAHRDERFRQAAETEDGMPVSAGARVIHIREAVESGQGFYIDLSSIPQHRRASVVSEIKELVLHASNSSGSDPQPVSL